MAPLRVRIRLRDRIRVRVRMRVRVMLRVRDSDSIAGYDLGQCAIKELPQLNRIDFKAACKHSRSSSGDKSSTSIFSASSVASDRDISCDSVFQVQLTSGFN